VPAPTPDLTFAAAFHFTCPITPISLLASTLNRDPAVGPFGLLYPSHWPQSLPRAAPFRLLTRVSTRFPAHISRSSRRIGVRLLYEGRLHASQAAQRLDQSAPQTLRPNNQCADPISTVTRNVESVNSLNTNPLIRFLFRLPTPPLPRRAMVKVASW